MTVQIHPKKIRPGLGSQQDDINEVVERWQQFRIISNRSQQYGQLVIEKPIPRPQARLFESVELIWAISGLVTLVIAARIGLKMVAVNAGTPFGRFIIELTDMLLRPFSGITETLATGHSALLELSALNAIILYPFTAWCLVQVLRFLFTPSR